MKYIVDNDLHIHSHISVCSGVAEQTPQRILEYAKDNNLKTICLTDHFWDETIDGADEFYEVQDYARIQKAKPLPQADGIRFLFGCETELTKDLTIALSKERMDLFDFIIIPTTHFHMEDFTLSYDEYKDVQSRAKAWVKRLDYVLSQDLPFHKIGLAHLTCPLIAPERSYCLDVINAIPESEMERVFTKAAEVGVGIELNGSDMGFADNEAETILRPYKVAKRCGCKFYCGSDAHSPLKFETVVRLFEKAVDMIGLTEDDKFIF